MFEKRDCKIVQDLLPNYVEKLTNEETNKFVEEHIKNCDECKNMLENMQKELDVNSNKVNEKDVKFLKKYSKKLRILKIILSIIFLVFFTITIRKTIILSNLNNKAKQYSETDNYYRHSTAYEKIHLVQMDVYKKGNKEHTIVKRMFEGKITTASAYSDGENTNIYYESAGKKTARLNTDIEMFNVENISPALDFDNIFQLFLVSIATNIKETELYGHKCYFITGYLDNYLYTGIDDAIYVDKETGLMIRNNWGNGNVTDFEYEFNTITDDEFVEPNLEEYEIIEN